MDKCYALYLRSDRWATKIRAIRERSGGICERCGCDWMDAVHHLTYKNIYDEPLKDLLGVCDACHRFLHHKSGYDPAKGSLLQKERKYLKAWQQEYYDNLALIEGA